MHLVFITSLVTTGTVDSGYALTSHAIVEGLRRQGVRVSEIGFHRPGSAPGDPSNTVSLGAVDAKTGSADMRTKLIWLGKALASNTPFASARLRIVSEGDLERALNEATTRNRPVDGVILNGTALAGAFETVLTRRPYVLVAHGMDPVSASQTGADMPGLIDALIHRREAVHARRLENRLCAGARHVVTLADADREGLGLSKDRASVLPLVTPQPPARPRDARIKAFDVGVIGTWTLAQNRIGLEWFVRDVVPHLPKGMSVAVAGKTPRGFRARDQRVVLLGGVHDGRDFCRQCRVMAMTARVGTGVQLETIEAFEMGLPVVATPSSMRGIVHRPPNALVADDARRFAKALTKQVFDHRAGRVDEVDGLAFRRTQMEEMDEVLASMVAVFRD